MNLNLPVIKTSTAFCNKIWQATRFLLLSRERSKTCQVEDVFDMASKNQTR